MAANGCVTLLTLPDLEAMTQTNGEGWALSHVRRVQRLAELIGVDLRYDQQHALKISIYLPVGFYQ
jgi:hypothetical protein